MRWIIHLILLLCFILPFIDAQEVAYFREDQNRSTVWINITANIGQNITLQFFNLSPHSPNPQAIFPLLFDDFNDGVFNDSLWWNHSTGTTAIIKEADGENMYIDCLEGTDCWAHLVSHQNFTNNVTIIGGVYIGSDASSTERTFGFANCTREVGNTLCGRRGVRASNFAYRLDGPGNIKSRLYEANNTHNCIDSSSSNCFLNSFTFTGTPFVLSVDRFSNETIWKKYDAPMSEIVSHLGNSEVWPNDIEMAVIAEDRSAASTGGGAFINLNWVAVYPSIRSPPTQTVRSIGPLLEITLIAQQTMINQPIRLIGITFGGNLTIATNLTQYVNATHLATPKFMSAPYVKGDIVRAASIFRQDFGQNATIREEWFINGSLQINRSFGVSPNSSFLVNASTTFSEPGTNLTVFLRAESYESSIKRNASITIVIPQCQDGIDNDFDGFIDYPTDPHCTSLLDNDEDQPETVSSEQVECVATSAGGSYTPISYDPIESIFNLEAPQQSLIEDIFDTLKPEDCGNEIDDNNDGFIDEDCKRSIEVTTENFQKRYHFVLSPGEIRETILLVKNLESSVADTSVSCTGSPLCSKVKLQPDGFTNAPNKEQKVQLSINIPMTETVGNKYVFKVVGRDITHKSSDNVLVSVTISSSGGLVRRFSEVFTKPFYCTSVATDKGKNFCLDPFRIIASLFAIALTLYIVTQVWTRVKK